jgi:hypothetical protein
MRKNKLFLLITALLITLALYLVLTEKNTSLFSSDSEFAVKDTANIVQIFMADKNNNSLLFERKENFWIIGGEGKVHEKNIEMLLTTLKNLEVKYPVPLKAHDNIVKVMAASSIKVEVYKNDYRIRLGSLRLFPFVNKAKTFYVGAVTQDNQGTYMLLEGADRPFVVTMPGFRGFVAARFTTNPQDWLSHEIFRIPYKNIQEVSVESSKEKNKNYRIRKLDSGYEIMSLNNRQILQSYDTVALYTFLDAFKNINYESLLDAMPEEKVDSILKSEPVYTISLKEVNGQEHKIKTYLMFSRYDQEEKYGFRPEYDLDRMYAWHNDKMLMIQYFVFDKITRPVEFFYPQQQ